MKKRICGFFLAILLILAPSHMVFADNAAGLGRDDVREIQQELRKRGFVSDEDGVYGAGTKKAVKQFQKAQGMKVDGIINAATYTALTGKRLSKNSRKSDISPESQRKRTSNADTATGVKEPVRAVIAEAKKYIGTPYAFGGTTPRGFDCSGFMQYIFKKKGVWLPRSADEQYARGKRIRLGMLEPGDLVFFHTYSSGVSHSGLYLGNGEFISATSSRGVRIDTLRDGYWHEHYVGAKRVL